MSIRSIYYLLSKLFINLVLPFQFHSWSCKYLNRLNSICSLVSKDYFSNMVLFSDLFNSTSLHLESQSSIFLKYFIDFTQNTATSLAAIIDIIFIHIVKPHHHIFVLWQSLLTTCINIFSIFLTYFWKSLEILSTLLETYFKQNQ